VISYLRKRDVSESQTEAIVERITQSGLLDDEAFAQFWVENRERFRPRGVRALRYELRGKGLDDEVIEQALASVDASASAYRAAGKKARQWSQLDESEFRRKLVAFLARRGFDYSVAREVVERLWVELATGD
jgi:regulatory protein